MAPGPGDHPLRRGGTTAEERQDGKGVSISEEGGPRAVVSFTGVDWDTQARIDGPTARASG